MILQLLGLFIIARGLGWVFWGLGGGVQVGGGGGGGKVEFLTEKKNFAKKCSWGLKTHANKNLFFGGGGDFGVFGGRAGLENNTLLPMTMICVTG